jgi:hypothetical protein
MYFLIKITPFRVKNSFRKIMNFCFIRCSLNTWTAIVKVKTKCLNCNFPNECQENRVVQAQMTGLQELTFHLLSTVKYVMRILRLTQIDLEFQYHIDCWDSKDCQVCWVRPSRRREYSERSWFEKAVTIFSGLRIFSGCLKKTK